MAQPPSGLRAVLTKSMKPGKPMPMKPMASAPTRFNQAGKPDPAGLYDKDGYMTQVPGKANSFTKQPAAPTTPTKSPDQMALEKAAANEKMMAARRKMKR